ncbi:Fatty-acid amide hydrolase 1 [Neolecta irregularis DAH-3]|uniref:amidase n=1 Tax=Neolecta irregularis (strain DAH-3) TaxID=1198029 RepID=A0A1U7LPJ0_NEOID|nr:Fatty-acid amide hydrolase 1 [Neolecta irregularis DAH-3]|eukprot:OLL24590.1 Fatty-acid amide hydrolase 1 [Neolecta irregularis DAH-3]
MLFHHHGKCALKKAERANRVSNLPAIYHSSISDRDAEILASPLEALIHLIKKGEWFPKDVLVAYTKKALEAHKETNCLTEIMVKDAETWAENTNLQTSLAGVPVSLKDTINIAGYDSCIGYSAWTFKPALKDSPLVRLLKDAGAVPFVKTNVPITLLSFESYNDVWGRTTNPHNKDYSPGGSSGGESALIASGGSIIGVVSGTDVAGSVRIPAHFAGIYTIKCSTGRFPKMGNASAMPGQEGVKACYSPMTRSMDSLVYFLKAVIDMKPWTYDASCEPIPWRDVQLPQKLKIGVLRDDGVVIASPACSRALEETVSALSAQGHSIVPFYPPSCKHALEVASQLLLADGGKVAMRPFRFWENNDAGVSQLMRVLRLPNWIRRIWSFWIRLFGDSVYADLIQNFREQNMEEQNGLVVKREKYRQAFLEAWNEADLDILLTVPNATPALPHNSLKNSIASCGYSLLFNLLDYSAGVFPVTRVDAIKDKLPLTFRPRNAIEKGAFQNYHAERMHGLPVGVQVVGLKLQEEWVLKAMQVAQEALEMHGVKYE